MSHDFKMLYLLNGASYAMFHEHILYHIQYMVFQFTSLHLTLGGIERSNQGQLVFIGLYIMLSVLLDSGTVRPRGPLLPFHKLSKPNVNNTYMSASSLKITPFRATANTLLHIFVVYLLLHDRLVMHECAWMIGHALSHRHDIYKWKWIYIMAWDHACKYICRCLVFAPKH